MTRAKQFEVTLRFVCMCPSNVLMSLGVTRAMAVLVARMLAGGALGYVD